MSRMWMVRGEGGSLYDAFRERGVAAVGWNQLAEHARPDVVRKQLIALYQFAEPLAKQGTVASGASQVWRFVNDIAGGRLGPSSIRLPIACTQSARSSTIPSGPSKVCRWCARFSGKRRNCHATT